MNRQAQAVIMLLFGGAILKASIGDIYLRYVKEGLRPFLIAAGFLLVAAAVMTLWYEFRPHRKPQALNKPTDAALAPATVSASALAPAPRTTGALSAASLDTGNGAVPPPSAGRQEEDAGRQEESGGQKEEGTGREEEGAGQKDVHQQDGAHGEAQRDHDHGRLQQEADHQGVQQEDQHDDGHGHHHEPRVGWLLILPVLGLLLVTPPALGSYAAGQAGTVLSAQQSGSDYPPLPAGDPVDVALLDYASRAVFDDGRSLTGRVVRLTGFVTPGADGQPMLARMVLSCCAADGRPIKVGLAGSVPAGVAPDTWVQVVGAYTDKVAKDPVNDADVPYLQVTSWQEITAPKQQYE